MEITKIKRNGAEVNVIFTGEQYIFHNAFYGILAVAQRKGYKKEDANHFTVYYGNHQTIGGSFAGDCCFIMAKNFIKKSEDRYIKQNTTFEAVKEDLDAWWMDFKAKKR